jgi:hypothetical protein
MSEAEHRALMLRSEALNQKYGLGKQKGAALTSQPTNSTRASRGELSGSAPP